MVNSSPPSTGEYVVGAHHGFDLVYQSLQDDVACGVSMRIVDMLEVVDIEDDHARQMAITDATGSFSQGCILHSPAIQGPGKRIGSCLFCQFLA